MADGTDGTVSGGAVIGGTDGADTGGVTPPDAADTITITIPEGATLEQIGNILYESGLVANTEDFTYAYNSMQKPGIKAGSITVNSNCTMEELVNAVSL